MPKLSDEEVTKLKLLFSIIDNQGVKTIDWAAVAEANGINVPAARMRFTRLKRSLEAGQNGEGEGEGEAEGAIADANENGESVADVSTPKKGAATKKRATPKKEKATPKKGATTPKSKKRKLESETEEAEENVENGVGVQANVKEEDKE